MKWTVTVTIDTERDSPNVIGEFLRGKFWDQSPNKHYPHGRTGCYSSFDYNADVEPLWLEKEEDGWNYIEWNCARWDDVKCRWYWDGDGTIEFLFPDGTVLENTDCKKDYGWTWVEDPLPLARCSS